MTHDAETGYYFYLEDKERKEMIENELGLTCTIINHRTILVTDGGKKIQLYPSRYFVQTHPQERGNIKNYNLLEFLKKQFNI